MTRASFAWLLAGLLAAIGAAPALAHDVPAEARVHAFVKPEGERLQVYLRIPLALLLNVNLPKRGPGYIDLDHVAAAYPQALAAVDRGIDFFEDSRRLSPVERSARISQPSDGSFASYEDARALLEGPALPASASVFWNQGYFDAHLAYPIRSPRSSFSVDFHVSPGRGARLKFDVRYVSPEGSVHAFEVPTASGPLIFVPRWYQAALSFVKAGFVHILEGRDHLLFLLCLILPFRRIDWPLVGVITAFTIAHSITLLAAGFGLAPRGAWFAPLVEALIAASILYTAIENAVRPRLARRWLVAGIFGLVHGFGFSFLLRTQLQLAGSHLLTSLFAFNIGIELGQLLVLVLALPVLGLLYRSRMAGERWVVVIGSILLAHTAWHWMLDRLAALQRTDWPIPDLALLDAIAMIALLGALAWGLAWAAAGRRLGAARRAEPR